MKLLNIHTGITTTLLTVIEFKKDGFRKGEYSIYKRTYRDERISSETYLFGVSKRYEAAVACLVLNQYDIKRK